jgi:hypothetical protein
MLKLKSLTLCVAPTPGTENPIIRKRLKLIERLEQQRRLAKDPTFSISVNRTIKSPEGVKSVIERQKRVKAWWRKDETGQVVMSLIVGFKVIEIEKGKSGILVGSLDQMDSVITTIIDAVQAGELDQHLTTAKREAKASTAGGSRRTLTLPHNGAVQSAQ